MNLLITNIKELAQVRRGEDALHWVAGNDMASLPSLTNAYLLIEEGRITDFGPMAEVPDVSFKTIDATGKYVLPAFVDSHTHLVFAASREEEFVDKIKGLSYAEIAK